MTAAELAAYFEVSTRTIYRDIDALSECRIPIYMSKGKNGGIRLLDNYKLDKALLSDEEQKQILFSLQSINKLEIDNTSTYEKLKQIFPNKIPIGLKLIFPYGADLSDIKKTLSC